MCVKHLRWCKRIANSWITGADGAERRREILIPDLLDDLLALPADAILRVLQQDAGIAKLLAQGI